MIEIIDLLKPKNGGSFKLIEAIDVSVDGYTSLADCVSHMATTAMIEAINAVLSGKQDKLTTAQLTAVNSGITSELVTQIGINTTAITGKADEADLTTATASLQAQIDNIVSGSTADSEVINARVGTDGTSYGTLKARLDGEYNKQTNKANNIAENLAEFENYIYNNRLVSKKFDKINYGNYTITSEGLITYNTNYDSYIYAIDSNVDKVVINGTVAVCGWFDGDPLTEEYTIDSTRHTDYSNSTVNVVATTAYLFVNVLAGNNAPIITTTDGTVIDAIEKDILDLSDDYSKLIGDKASLPDTEWEIGTFVINANHEIEYKTRTYNIRTKQNTTKHLEKGMKLILDDDNGRFSLIVALKKGLQYFAKAVLATSYEVEETGDYVITIEDTNQQTLSNVNTILDNLTLLYAGLFDNSSSDKVNMFNYDTAVYGSFVADQETSNSRWYHSDYIDVESGKTYAISCTASTLGAYYNGSTYVDDIRKSASAQPSNYYSIFTVPSGVTKVRVNGYLEEGNGSPSVTVRPEAYMMVEGRIMPDEYISHNPNTNDIKIRQSMFPDWMLAGNVLHGKKLLTFGDSITDGRQHDYVYNSGLGYILNYAGYVAKRNEMTYYNKGWAGGTLSYGAKSMVASGDAFNILLTDIGTPDIITFMYGFNDSNNAEHHELGDLDSTDKATFCGAWNFTIPKIRTLYPNARIGIIIPYGLKEGWAEMMIRVANKFGIPYWNMNDGQTHCIRGNGTSDLDPDVSATLTAKYTIDGTHPNDAGYSLISTQFEAFLRRI